MASTMKEKNKEDRIVASSLLSSIKSNIQTLIDLISAQNPEYVGFEIEEILRVNEMKSLNGGIESLEVTKINEWQHCNRALNAWAKFNKEYDISPIFNFRLPGFVVIKSDHEKVAELVTLINSNKLALQELVIEGREYSVDRSAFIHSLDASVITEQLYRKIPLMTEEVKKVWFNWVSRPAPKIFEEEEFETYIRNKGNNKPLDYSDTEWNLKIAHIKKEFESGKYKSIHRFKRRQACPVIELKMINHQGKLERYQRPIAVPYILNGQKDGSPTFTDLESYSKEKMIAHETTKLSANKVWIDEDLKLIGVLKDV